MRLPGITPEGVTYPWMARAYWDTAPLYGPVWCADPLTTSRESQVTEPRPLQIVERVTHKSGHSAL